MRQMVITRHGEPDVFEARDAPTPEPGRGEVRIAVAAAGVNFADILIRQGLYSGGHAPPCVPGYEVAGVVEATGPGVDPGWRDRRVLALTDYDGYAQQHVIATDRVLACPDGLTLQAAAAVPLNYLTAWILLVVMGSLRPDQTVLIHNAGGGVGLAALDVARHVGARTLGTASRGKHAFLGQRGLDHAIDYRQPDWPEAVRDLTRGRGVDLIIDPLGPRNWRRSLGLLGPTGRLGVFGISEAAASGPAGKLRLLRSFLSAPLVHPGRLLTGNRGIFGCNVHRMYDRKEALSRWLGEVLEGVEAGWARPHVDRVFPLEQAADAHRWIEARRNTGKVLLEP